MAAELHAEVKLTFEQIDINKIKAGEIIERKALKNALSESNSILKADDFDVKSSLEKIQFFINHAYILFSLNQFKEALEKNEEARKLNETTRSGKESDIKEQKNFLDTTIKKIIRAAEAHLKLNKKDPTSGINVDTCLQYAAVLRYQNKNLKKVLLLYEKASQKRPNNFESVLSQIATLCALKRKQEAIQLLKEFFSRKKWVFSDSFTSASDAQAALSLLDPILNADPNNPKKLLRKAFIRSAAGDHEGAGRSFYGSALAFSALGKNEKALEAYNHALATNPKDTQFLTDFLAGRAQVLHTLKRDAERDSDLEEIRKLDGKKAAALKIQFRHLMPVAQERGEENKTAILADLLIGLEEDGGEAESAQSAQTTSSFSRLSVDGESTPDATRIISTSSTTPNLSPDGGDDSQPKNVSAKFQIKKRERKKADKLKSRRKFLKSSAKTRSSVDTTLVDEKQTPTITIDQFREQIQNFFDQGKFEEIIRLLDDNTPYYENNAEFINLKKHCLHETSERIKEQEGQQHLKLNDSIQRRDLKKVWEMYDESNSVTFISHTLRQVLTIAESKEDIQERWEICAQILSRDPENSRAKELSEAHTTILLKDAKNFLALGDLNNARLRCEQISNIDPNNRLLRNIQLSLILSEANELLKTNNWQAAWSLCKKEQVWEKYPRHTLVQNLLERILLPALKDKTWSTVASSSLEVLDICERVLVKNKYHSTAIKSRNQIIQNILATAEKLFAAEKWEQSRKIYQQILARVPKEKKQKISCKMADDFYNMAIGKLFPTTSNQSHKTFQESLESLREGNHSSLLQHAIDVCHAAKSFNQKYTSKLAFLLICTNRKFDENLAGEEKLKSNFCNAVLQEEKGDLQKTLTAYQDVIDKLILELYPEPKSRQEKLFDKNGVPEEGQVLADGEEPSQSVELSRQLKLILATAHCAMGDAFKDTDNQQQKRANYKIAIEGYETVFGQYISAKSANLYYSEEYQWQEALVAFAIYQTLKKLIEINKNNKNIKTVEELKEISGFVNRGSHLMKQYGVVFDYLTTIPAVLLRLSVAGVVEMPSSFADIGKISFGGEIREAKEQIEKNPVNIEDPALPKLSTANNSDDDESKQSFVETRDSDSSNSLSDHSAASSPTSSSSHSETFTPANHTHAVSPDLSTTSTQNQNEEKQDGYSIESASVSSKETANEEAKQDLKDGEKSEVSAVPPKQNKNSINLPEAISQHTSIIKTLRATKKLDSNDIVCVIAAYYGAIEDNHESFEAYFGYASVCYLYGQHNDESVSTEDKKRYLEEAIKKYEFILSSDSIVKTDWQRAITHHALGNAYSVVEEQLEKTRLYASEPSKEFQKTERHYKEAVLVYLDQSKHNQTLTQTQKKLAARGLNNFPKNKIIESDFDHSVQTLLGKLETADDGFFIANINTEFPDTNLINLLAASMINVKIHDEILAETAPSVENKHVGENEENESNLVLQKEFEARVKEVPELEYTSCSLTKAIRKHLSSVKKTLEGIESDRNAALEAYKHALKNKPKKSEKKKSVQIFQKRAHNKIGAYIGRATLQLSKLTSPDNEQTIDEKITNLTSIISQLDSASGFKQNTALQTIVAQHVAYDTECVLVEMVTDNWEDCNKREGIQKKMGLSRAEIIKTYLATLKGDTILISELQKKAILVSLLWFLDDKKLAVEYKSKINEVLSKNNFKDEVSRTSLRKIFPATSLARLVVAGMVDLATYNEFFGIAIECETKRGGTTPEEQKAEGPTSTLSAVGILDSFTLAVSKLTRNKTISFSPAAVSPVAAAATTANSAENDSGAENTVVPEDEATQPVEAVTIDKGADEVKASAPPVVPTPPAKEWLPAGLYGRLKRAIQPHPRSSTKLTALPPSNELVVVAATFPAAEIKFGATPAEKSGE